MRNWLKQAVKRAGEDGVHFSIPVTPHTFRHSYIMHMLYHRQPKKVIQALVGTLDGGVYPGVCTGAGGHAGGAIHRRRTGCGGDPAFTPSADVNIRGEHFQILSAINILTEACMLTYHSQYGGLPTPRSHIKYPTLSLFLIGHDGQH